MEHNDQQLHNLTHSINDMLAIIEIKASERIQRLDESTSNIRTVTVERLERHDGEARNNFVLILDAVKHQDQEIYNLTNTLNNLVTSEQKKQINLSNCGRSFLDQTGQYHSGSLRYDGASWKEQR